MSLGRLTSFHSIRYCWISKTISGLYPCVCLVAATFPAGTRENMLYREPPTYQSDAAFQTQAIHLLGKAHLPSQQHHISHYQACYPGLMSTRSPTTSGEDLRIASIASKRSSQDLDTLHGNRVTKDLYF